MDEYIPRKVVLNELDNIGFFDDEPIQTRNAALRIVNRIPSADVAPVVHGKWKRIDYEPYGHDYACSACNQLSGRARHYCPDCGAKMD